LYTLNDLSKKRLQRYGFHTAHTFPGRILKEKLFLTVILAFQIGFLFQQDAPQGLTFGGKDNDVG